MQVHEGFQFLAGEARLWALAVLLGVEAGDVGVLEDVGKLHVLCQLVHPPEFIELRRVLALYHAPQIGYLLFAHRAIDLVAASAGED